MTTFSDVVSKVLGCNPSANTLAYIFSAFVLFGFYAMLSLVRGAFHK